MIFPKALGIKQFIHYIQAWHMKLVTQLMLQQHIPWKPTGIIMMNRNRIISNIQTTCSIVLWAEILLRIDPHTIYLLHFTCILQSLLAQQLGRNRYHSFCTITSIWQYIMLAIILRQNFPIQP